MQMRINMCNFTPPAARVPASAEILAHQLLFIVRLDTDAKGGKKSAEQSFNGTVRCFAIWLIYRINC